MTATPLTDSYAVRDTDRDEREGCMLLGPNGWRCCLGELEDRTWDRDGAIVVDRLNEQHAEILKLRAELARLRQPRAGAVPEVECPGPNCPMCSGAACEKCNPGPGMPRCEHDGLERHEHPTPERPLCVADALRDERVLRGEMHVQYDGSKGPLVLRHDGRNWFCRAPRINEEAVVALIRIDWLRRSATLIPAPAGGEG